MSEDLPRASTEKRFSNEQMKELMISHKKYVRWFALRFLRSSRRYIWEQNVGCFSTEDNRSEDLESVLWESIFLGKGTNKEALAFALKKYLYDKTKKKRKYDITIVSLPTAEKLGSYDIDRLRKHWEMTYGGSEDHNDPESIQSGHADAMGQE